MNSIEEKSKRVIKQFGELVKQVIRPIIEANLDVLKQNSSYIIDDELSYELLEEEKDGELFYSFSFDSKDHIRVTKSVKNSNPEIENLINEFGEKSKCVISSFIEQLINDKPVKKILLPDDPDEFDRLMKSSSFSEIMNLVDEDYENIINYIRKYNFQHPNAIFADKIIYSIAVKKYNGKLSFDINLLSGDHSKILLKKDTLSKY